MKTIRTCFTINQQLLTSPEWGRVFEPIRNRYGRDLWLYRPLHVTEGRDQYGTRWCRKKITYVVDRPNARMFITIRGPWECTDPARWPDGELIEW